MLKLVKMIQIRIRPRELYFLGECLFYRYENDVGFFLFFIHI